METAQLYISQGLGLLWRGSALFTEFAVEAVIAWQQKQDLMVANLTGSLTSRGFGWPLIYFANAFFAGGFAQEKWPKIRLAGY